MEIERKYLIDTLPNNLSEYKYDTITQGYISTSPVIRIRKKSDAYILTYKSKGLMVREEFEVELCKEEFNNLKEKVEYNLIAKTRYYIPYNALTIELDVFHNQLEGLLMAEVEFRSIEDCDKFSPPKWFGDEVTQDNRYQNNYLCKLDNISSHISLE